MSQGEESYEVRVYSNMVQVGEKETFGDVRSWTYGISEDAPPGAVHKDGDRNVFDDEDVVAEELGTPLIGWVIVFEEPPLEDYSYYRYPQFEGE
ncbi:hypothetical protein [Natrinema sp. SYSU A 869]|uniref:hypothetical protein n=1 Tax=Natrinema sp. SYSU A 869 TaxID=2871694 RepID=UPI001CA40928|nr:hypothetical protein [Natrinema sp. SYSU A 869]